MRDSGSPSRALVMRSGADSEMTSGLGGPEVDVIKQAPGMRRDGQTPLASAELYVIIDLPKRSHQHGGQRADARRRADGRSQVRDEVSIVEGRMFEFGTNEVVVGRGASAQFAGLTRRQRGAIGPEHAGRSSASSRPTAASSETEIWCDARVLQGAYRRGNTYQTVLARLDSTDSFDTLPRLADRRTRR